jgi:tetratricopeptide (TPR) repeat protein
MNEKLCDWLEEELELKELSGRLRESILQNGSVEQFVVMILAYSSIYTAAELKRVQEVLEKLKNQKPIEKQKYKADNLLESGAVNQAILIYQSIIQGEVDESVDKRFYGRVYGCLGTAYGRMFLYEEAAKMYEAAFQICEEESMLKAYLYACSKYMDQRDYEAMLERSQIYRAIDLDIQEILGDIEDKMRFSMKEDTLEVWKEEYRKIGTGER